MKTMFLVSVIAGDSIVVSTLEDWTAPLLSGAALTEASQYPICLSILTKTFSFPSEPLTNTSGMFSWQ